jgi:hypothetical protein
LNAQGFDRAIVVKRLLPTLGFIGKAKKCGAKVVYDIVDAWPQPAGNYWPRSLCLSWLRDELAVAGADGLVASSAQMADDCRSITGIPTLNLKHHARPSQARNPIRERVQTVGYEGGERYLGVWREWIERECSNRGWRFVVNPPALADLDIVVAVREADGYAARHWKSNVKLANAQGSGTPIVCNRAAAYLDTAGGGECWADNAEQLRECFDELTDHGTRRTKSEALLRAAPTLDSVAATYRSWLETLQ